MLTVLKKLDRAEEVFRSIIESHPEIDTGYVELGRLKHVAGNHRQATALFEKALHLKGDKAIPLTLLGSIYLQQKKYQEAEKHFKAAIKASPRWARPHYALVALYSQTNRLREAADYLQRIYTQNPGSLRVGFTLSVLYQELEQYNKAISLLEELVAKYPNVFTINNNLAYLYAEHFSDSERLKKASECAHKALNKAPDNPRVLDTVAWVEFKRGNTHDAIKYANSAVKGAEKNPMINFHAGLINATMGKHQAAKKYLSKAMELGLPKEEYAKEAERILKTMELRN